MKPVVAIDVGGTLMKGAVVDAELRIHHARTVPTPRDAVVDGIIALAAELAGHGAAPDGVAAAGIVVPGIVDEDRGIGILSTNLGWSNLPLRDLLAAGLDVPLAFGHDVRAGGLAEARLGAARGAGIALFVALGTGIAAAVLVDGQPVAGGGYAGELGHLPVAPDGPPCGCGQRGCLETIASAAAVARRYAQRTGRQAGSAQIAASAEPLAAAVWAEAVEALATGLTIAVTLLGPEIIVVGGGLAEAGDRLLEPLRAALERRLTFQRRPRVATAELGDRAGMYGAALLAMAAR